MIQLRTKNLKKYYQRGPYLIKALDGIDLEVERGCFLAVMGISGSGKSTLLNLNICMRRCWSGRGQMHI